MNRTSVLVAPASACAAALTTFVNAIQGIGASGTAAIDMATLISEDEAVISDLNAVGITSNFSDWMSQLISDGGEATIAGDTVRAALGLPAS